jgi:glutaminyl-peptide cyclotransferase
VKHGFLTQVVAVLLTLGSVVACADVPILKARVVNTFPHDPDAFTQGLVVLGGELYEGTGRNGQSSLRRVALETGEVLQRHNLGSLYFGEGITIMGERIYQLTWQSQIGFVYDRASFKLQKTFLLPGEGWGITHDDTHLIVSDGTAFLRFLDPETQAEVKRVTVTEDGLPLERLNELEFIDGEVWANVWYTDFIVRIDPKTGNVTSKVDLSGLHEQRGADDVLNGIAWDEMSDRLFVTGKLWSSLYEIDVVEAAAE